MTDQEIREYLSRDVDEEDLCRTPHKHLRPLLKELLSYRSLNLLPCWRVWCPDPNPSGWRPVAAFESEGMARRYREKALSRICKVLVLEGHEQPSETAR